VSSRHSVFSVVLMGGRTTAQEGTSSGFFFFVLENSPVPFIRLSFSSSGELSKYIALITLPLPSSRSFTFVSFLSSLSPVGARQLSQLTTPVKERPPGRNPISTLPFEH